MKKFLLILLMVLFISFPVYASEVKGNLTGIVISSYEKQLKINEIQLKINRIFSLIAELQRLLNKLRG